MAVSQCTKVQRGCRSERGDVCREHKDHSAVTGRLILADLDCCVCVCVFVLLDL